MNRQEREALIAKHKAENDIAYSEIAIRRAQREAEGDVSDLLITKSEPATSSMALPPHVVAEIRQWARETQNGRTESAPSTHAAWNDWLHRAISANNDLVADEIGALVAESINTAIDELRTELMSEIASLRDELAMERSGVTRIGKHVA